MSGSPTERLCCLSWEVCLWMCQAGLSRTPGWLDLVGPLPPSRGCNYIMTVIDRTTRCHEAFPLASIISEDFSRTSTLGWVAHFGIPLNITSDRGCQFTSSLRTHLVCIGLMTYPGCCFLSKWLPNQTFTSHRPPWPSATCLSYPAPLSLLVQCQVSTSHVSHIITALHPSPSLTPNSLMLLMYLFKWMLTAHPPWPTLPGSIPHDLQRL